MRKQAPHTQSAISNPYSNEIKLMRMIPIQSVTQLTVILGLLEGFTRMNTQIMTNPPIMRKMGPDTCLMYPQESPKMNFSKVKQMKKVTIFHRSILTVLLYFSSMLENINPQVTCRIVRTGKSIVRRLVQKEQNTSMIQFTPMLGRLRRMEQVKISQSFEFIACTLLGRLRQQQIASPISEATTMMMGTSSMMLMLFRICTEYWMAEQQDCSMLESEYPKLKPLDQRKTSISAKMCGLMFLY